MELSVKQLRSESGHHSGFASADRKLAPKASEHDVNISADSPDIMSRLLRVPFLGG